MSYYRPIAPLSNEHLNLEVARRLQPGHPAAGQIGDAAAGPAAPMATTAAGSGAVADELLARLSQLSQEVAAKEREIAASNAAKSFMERDLEGLRTELQAAREELHNEATKTSLLEQRMRRQGEEVAHLRAELETVSAERDTLHRTMHLVQSQLSSSKAESQERGVEVAELQSYYSSLLEAREASIQSLQNLLEAQQKSFQDQQQVWEEQRYSLRASLADLTGRVHASSQATSMSNQAAFAELKTKLAAAEAAVVEAEGRNRKLVTHVKEREKLLSKLQRKYDDLRIKQDTSATGRTGGAGASDPDDASMVRILEDALRSLKDVSLDRDTLRSQLELINEAFEDEQRRREKLRARLASVQRECDDTQAEAARLRAELERVQVELSDKRRQLHDFQQGHAEAALRTDRLRSDLQHQADLRLAEEASRAQRRIQELELQLRHARDSSASGASDVLSSSTAGMLTNAEHVAILRQRLVRQRQEFELLLERVADESRSVGAPLPSAAELRRMMDKHLSQVDTIASLAALPEGRREDPAMQHSVFVIRANWSTLRKLLLQLQDAVASAAELGSSSNSSATAAFLKSPEFTSRLMSEWEVGDKVALDLAVESSCSAAAALLQEAVTRLQAVTVDSAVVREQLREAEEAVAKLRLANSLGQQDAESQLIAVRDEASELRQQLSRLRAEASALQLELNHRGGELDVVRERAESSAQRARRAEEALAQVEADKARLKRSLGMLEGSKGNAEAAVAAADGELQRCQHTIGDLQATVALLHKRLEAQQAASAREVEGLKIKLRDVITALESPSLEQLHAMMSLAGAPGAGPPASAAGGATGNSRAWALVAAPWHSGSARLGTASGRPGTAGSLLTNEDLDHMALGIAQAGGLGSALHPDAATNTLYATLDAAANSCSAAVHHLALLEVSHHELEQGTGAVARLKEYLGGARTEMMAGRYAVGSVLLGELLEMLEDGSSGGTGGSNDTRVDNAALRSKLLAARDVAQHLTKHMKNVEGLLLALRGALPEFMELTTARVKAGHRSELSRLRGLLGSQLTAVRRDLASMRDMCRHTMADMQAQAAQALEQAQGMAAAADRERSQAALLLMNLTSMANETAAYAAEPITQPLGSFGSGFSNRPPAPTGPQGLLEGVAAAQRAVAALRTEVERMRSERRAMLSDGDSHRGHSEALQACLTRLVHTLQTLVPVPDPLIRGLQDPEPSVFSYSLLQLRELVIHAMAAERQAGSDQVVAEQVLPLQQRVADLMGQLETARRRHGTLEVQAQSFAQAAEAALVTVRQAAGEAAAMVLDGIMGNVMDEVNNMQDAVRDIQDASGSVLRQVNQAWQSQLGAACSSGATAVTALEETALLLQTQLGREADAYDQLKAQLEEALKEHGERQSSDSTRVRQLQVELASSRERLATLEVAEASHQEENKALKKALRQRDMMVMGMLQEEVPAPPSTGTGGTGTQASTPSSTTAAAAAAAALAAGGPPGTMGRG